MLFQSHHVCSIYKNITEQIQITIQFFAEGLNNKERCVCISDQDTREKLTIELEKNNFKTKEYTELGQILFLDNSDVYLENNKLNTDRVINIIKKAEEQSTKDGFNNIRFSGELPFVSKESIDQDSIVKYEAAVDKYFLSNKSTAICHYNETKYPLELLEKMIQTHHYVSIYGKLYENKYFYTYPEYLDQNTVSFSSKNYKDIINTIIES